jgi:phenylalanine-4-hydroxylase
MCLSACVQFRQYLQGFGSLEVWREERIHDKFRIVHVLEKSSHFLKIKVSGEAVSAYFHAV